MCVQTPTNRENGLLSSELDNRTELSLPILLSLLLIIIRCWHTMSIGTDNVWPTAEANPPAINDRKVGSILKSPNFSRTPSYVPTYAMPTTDVTHWFQGPMQHDIYANAIHKILRSKTITWWNKNEPENNWSDLTKNPLYNPFQPSFAIIDLAPCTIPVYKLLPCCITNLVRIRDMGYKTVLTVNEPMPANGKNM